MAIDGICVRVRQPYRTEVKDIKSWRCRKGGFALIVLAGCDINGKFLMATADHSGSTNDCIAWQTSALYAAMSEGRLDDKFFIIGDEAFSNTQQFLSPYPGRGLDVWKDSFNYWLSHSRQCVERGFGMLIMRWGIFWRKFNFDFERWSQVIITCIKLHNFCMDRRVPLPEKRYHEDYQRGDRLLLLDNNDPVNDALLRNRSTGTRRFNITKE